MPLPTGAQVGRYRIDARLGGGGMGEVYRAVDTTLGREVALKLISSARISDPNLLRRFAREAQAASALNHPNIVSVFDAGDSEFGPFIVMELIVGRTLRSVARDSSGPDVAVAIGRQVARALAVAHAAGIVHRDIKPENVMVRDDGYVKVLDFGIARMAAPFSDSDTTDASTGVGLTGAAVVGTATYMSPEQARGDTITAATDVFTFGLVLYELATGRHPFASSGGTVGAVARMMSEVAVPPSRWNAAVPPTFDSLVGRMLDRNPRARPGAAEVDRALSTLAEGGTVTVRPALRSGQHLVGRGGALADLTEAFDRAAAGAGSVVAVGGEAGLGKTALVEHFLETIMASRPYLAARGRCSERHADGGAAYLPWLELLDSLRMRSSTGVGDVMRSVAPSWHAQVAPLSSGDSPEARALTVSRTGSHSMKRELWAFLEEAARHTALIVFFDDLHWADASTIDMLEYVAPRLAESHVLIVVTYRPSELAHNAHPFLPVKLDLQGRGILRDLQLQFLNYPDLEHYLALEFPDHQFPPGFAELLHARTEGHPLFMADALRDLRERGALSDDGGGWHLTRPIGEIGQAIPQSIRSMIDLTLGRLDDAERRVLLAAAVQGVEFDSAIAARALAIDAGEVEDRLAVIARRHALLRLVREFEYPDRSLTVRYRFVHALYQNALYGSLGPSRRATLSAAVAGALVPAYGDQANAHAAELGYLHEAARDFSRAAEMFLIASERARQIFADRDALALARRAMTMLQALPDTPERATREVMHLMAIALPMHAVRGYAAPELEATYARARALCDQLGEHPLRFGVITGIAAFHFMRAELRQSEELIEPLLRLSAQTGNPVMRIWACWVHGATYSHIGEKYEEAFERFDEGARLYTPDLHPAFMLLTGFDAGIGCDMQAARLAWILGRPDEAAERSARALRLARDLRHPWMIGFALFFNAWIHQYRDDPEAVRAAAEEAIALSERHGYPQLIAWMGAFNGWAVAKLGEAARGAILIREAIAATEAMGIALLRPTFLAYLAESEAAHGDWAAARATLARAADIAQRTGECCWLPEIYRLTAEAQLTDAELRDRAESTLRMALTIASRQHAHGFVGRTEAALRRV